MRIIPVHIEALHHCWVIKEDSDYEGHLCSPPGQLCSSHGRGPALKSSWLEASTWRLPSHGSEAPCSEYPGSCSTWVPVECIQEEGKSPAWPISTLSITGLTPHLVSLKKTFLKVKCHGSTHQHSWAGEMAEWIKTQGTWVWRLESGSPEPTQGKIQSQPCTSVIPACTYDQGGTRESLEAHVSACLAYVEVNNTIPCHKQDGRQGPIPEVILWSPHTYCGMWCIQHTHKHVHTHTQCTHIHTFQDKFLT